MHRCYTDVRWEYSIKSNRKSDVKNPQTSLRENSNTFREFFRFKNGKKNRKLQYHAHPAISDTCDMVATWVLQFATFSANFRSRNVYIPFVYFLVRNFRQILTGMDRFQSSIVKNSAGMCPGVQEKKIKRIFLIQSE